MKWGDPVFSSVLAGGYLGLMTLVWLALAWGAPRWGEAFRLRPRPAPSGARVSVCVPARNEEGRIGPCVRHLLASEGVTFEVVVVDDQSEDRTAAEALEAAGGDSRVRVVRGVDRPPGWAGKPWACQRAAGEAAFEHILFLDADVRVAPWALASALAEMDERKLAMLSIFGDWELVGFWEKVVIPVVGWFIRGSVDLVAVNDPARLEAFANGQFILVRRDSYEQLGGHALVRAEVLEDVRIARAFKQRAARVGVLHAPGAFHVRLYESLAQIVSGYGKNLFEGMDRRFSLGVGALIFVFTTTLLPFLALLGGLAANLLLGWRVGGPFWMGWLGLVCVLVLAFRFQRERADGRGGLYALTHPLGNVVFCLILVRSMLGLKSSWKGRSFVDGRAAP